MLRHGGTLNEQALQFVLCRVGGGPLAKNERYALGSYRELASACESIPSALAIGLRGPEAGRQKFQAVLVEGIDPLDPSSRENYPLQYQVHVYLRDRLPDSGKMCALRYIERIRRRVAIDNYTLFGAGTCARAEMRQLSLVA